MDKISYLYGHTSYPADETARNKFVYKEKYFNHRELLANDEPYYMNCVRINLNTPEIEKFNMGIEFSPPTYFVNDKCENSLVLNFVIGGKGTVNGKMFCSGDFYYTEPLQKNTLIAAPDDPWVTVFAIITGKYTESLLTLLKSKGDENILKIKNCEDIMKLAETFIYSLDCTSFSREYIKSILTILISYITDNADEIEFPSNSPSKAQRIVNSVKRHVNKNLATVTVSSLSEELHYERKYLTRVFSEIMGVTPQQYIIDTKMEWARNTLVQTPLSINEIMETIGYEYRSGFVTAFQKKYGCTPSEYRKREQIKENNKNT